MTPAPGPRAGTGPALRADVPAGAGTEEAGGGPLANSLARPAGRLGAGSAGGEGERVACGRRTALNFKLARGPLARGHLAGSGRGQLGAAAARHWRAGLSGGQRAGWRAGDRGKGGGQGGRKVSGV